MIAPSQMSENQTLSLAQRPPSQADVERKHHMAEAWKAYRGQFQKPLKISPSQPDDNVISNRCEPIVNKGCHSSLGKSSRLNVLMRPPNLTPRSKSFSMDSGATMTNV
jgi:hypothetical protein